MSKPEKNIIPISPVTAIVVITALLLIPLLFVGFLGQ